MGWSTKVGSTKCTQRNEEIRNWVRPICGARTQLHNLSATVGLTLSTGFFGLEKRLLSLILTLLTKKMELQKNWEILQIFFNTYFIFKSP